MTTRSFLNPSNEQQLFEFIEKRPLFKNLKIKSQINSTKSITPTANWSIPNEYKHLEAESISQIREILNLDLFTKRNINVPSPIDSFERMNISKFIVNALRIMKITSPTPIQMQGIPILLSGLSLFITSKSGTGKTLLYLLPILISSINRLITSNNSKISKKNIIALIITSNRELSIQIQETIMEINKNLIGYFPIVRVTLCIGGIESKSQKEEIDEGVDVIIGTPGRLSNILNRQSIESVEFLVFDELSLVIDPGMDIEIEKILESVGRIKQIVISTNVLSHYIQNYILNYYEKMVILRNNEEELIDSRIRFDFEYVNEELRLIHLLNTIQKTRPPVMIFCENKYEVDKVYEYLIIKGLDCCFIHGDKPQHERSISLKYIKDEVKDILVSTDIISKGIYMNNSIKHIINFSMPKEIEVFLNRVSRMSQINDEDEFPLVSTFITKSIDEVIVTNMKYIFIKSRIPIPSILEIINPNDFITSYECPVCGYNGHVFENCYRFVSYNTKVIK